MTKKILPMMIGVALAGGMTTAAADVSLFGHIDTSYDATDVDGGHDDQNLHCTTCSIGFKGSEDLGNGLKAIFSIDFQYNTTERNSRSTSNDGLGGAQDDTNGNEPVADAITDRDQWLGLSSNFGQVRIGTISTVYKSHGAMIDPLYRTALQGRDHGLQSGYFHSGAGEELQGRATNTIRYDSPSYSGFKVGGHYTLDNNKNNPPPGEDKDPYGIGASYENGGALVFVDWMDNGQGGPGNVEAWKVGGKYDMGMFSVMGQYENAKGDKTISKEEDVWHIAGTGSLFGITAYLGYGMGKDDASNDEYTTWTLAAMHNFSKNTMVYVGHSQVDCDTGGPSATLDVCSGTATNGGEKDQTSFGLKHKF
jgi:predicted porin